VAGRVPHPDGAPWQGRARLPRCWLLGPGMLGPALPRCWLLGPGLLGSRLLGPGLPRLGDLVRPHGAFDRIFVPNWY